VGWRGPATPGIFEIEPQGHSKYLLSRQFISETLLGLAVAHGRFPCGAVPSRDLACENFLCACSPSVAHVCLVGVQL
jgi:hypothetical protein